MLCVCHKHSNTEAILFTCLSSGWATTTGRLLGPKMGNNVSFPRTQRRATERGVEQRYVTFRLQPGALTTEPHSRRFIAIVAINSAVPRI